MLKTFKEMLNKSKRSRVNKRREPISNHGVKNKTNREPLSSLEEWLDSKELQWHDDEYDVDKDW